MMIPTRIIKSKKDVNVVLMGDWHLGNVACDEGLLDVYIEWIKDNNAYVILMGDMIEASNPNHMTSSGVMFEQDETPQNQFEHMKRILEPIKDRIICIVSGNHENRIYNYSGIDILKVYTDELDIPYLPAGGYFTVRINNIDYHMALFHGCGGSQNPRMQIEKAMRVWTDMDLVAIAHSHQLYEEYFPKFMILNGEQAVHKIYAVRTGGFLQYPEYAQRKFFTLSATGAAIVKLNHKVKNINVDTSGSIGKTIFN
jgi:predicted phosphodiesterase